MPSPTNVFSSTDTTSSTSISVTVTSDIPSGALVLVAVNRSLTGTAIATTASCADSAGNSWSPVAASTRSAAANVIIFQCKVSSALASGGSITVTWDAGFFNRKAMIAAVWNSEIDLSVSTSGLNYGTSSTSAGDHGNGTAASTSTDTPAAGMVVSAFSLNMGRTFSPDVPGSVIASVMTSTGSSDRGVVMSYYDSASSTTKTSSGTYNSSLSWAAASGTFGTATQPEPTANSEVVVGGTKKQVVSEYVIVGGQKRTVQNKWVIIGGQKKPV